MACKFNTGEALALRVSALLGAGADARADGVLWAALTGDGKSVPLAILEDLLAAGADATVDLLTTWSESRPSGGALYHALSDGTPEHARRLWRAGAPMTDPSLLCKLQRWPPSTVEDLAQAIAAQLESVDARQFPSSRTALTNACQNERAEWVQWLLARGADPSRVDSAGETPLGSAIRAGAIEVVELLLRGGAVPDDARLDGKDVLTWLGGGKSCQPMVELLRAHGATPVPKPRRKPAARKASTPGKHPTSPAQMWADILQQRDAKTQIADAITFLESHGLTCPSAVKRAVGSAEDVRSLISKGLHLSPGDYRKGLHAQHLLQLLAPARCVVVDTEALECPTDAEREAFYPGLLQQFAEAGNWTYTDLAAELRGETAQLHFVAFDIPHAWSIDMSSAHIDGSFFDYVDDLLAVHTPEQRCWACSDDYTMTIVTAPASLVAIWNDA
ncbi:ankyrin repeat domain-containing protein [Tahibacter amnicola]|uniref:Ankyrin repeat domain-containing protein n=1 Tax=Tahibacter amnicola TaxID=2976241 RepID=A0ABY6BAX0_9GAMM|nr:ankyrin repeat domain-containing protein [Tahibacter amnicola]UXI66834.1 ankyrin repeat domain-containing protein [Tahibacter amnicola]